MSSSHALSTRVGSIVRKLYAEAPAAFFSQGKYRYLLTRRWSDAPPLVSIMLNPSDAGADFDDPTVTKNIGFAKRWGAGGLAVVNLAALIATDPRELHAARCRGEDVVGPNNSVFVLQTVEQLRPMRVLAAWGNHGATLKNVAVVNRILVSHDLWCIKANKTGEPAHPLYQPYAREPFIWIRSPLGLAS